jgi:hypothetical protein
MTWGLYRGYVTTTTDPEGLYRIKAQIPQLLGQAETDWAFPCFLSGTYFVPNIGTQVWVGFENEDIEKPVWMGAVNSSSYTVNPTVVTPAVASSGGAITNSNPFPVDVYLHGGSISAISINGISIGNGQTYVRLGVGATLTLTYTGTAPTMVWLYT